MTDYSELVERLRERTFAKTPGMQRTCEEAAAAIEALREENEQLKFALDRWKLAESLDLECQCAPDKQVKTFTRNCGYVCGQCGKLIGLSDAALSPSVAPAASEPTIRETLTCKHGVLISYHCDECGPADAGAGPKPPRPLCDCKFPQPAPFNREWCYACGCPLRLVEQQSPALPEGGK